MPFQMTPDTDTTSREAELAEQEGRISLASARGALFCLLFLPLGAALGIWNWVLGGTVELGLGLVYIFFLVRALVFGLPARKTRVGRVGLLTNGAALALPCAVHWVAHTLFMH